MDKLIQKLLPPPPSRVHAWRDAISQRWQQLKPFQKYYLLASLCLPLHTGLSALLAIAGLVMDFWPRFVRAWESLAGKAAILLFYAVVANFAFASAAGMINELTGVSADFLPYSLNTALLLKLPGYALAISVLALVILGLVFPLLLLAIFLLRLIGVSHQQLFRNIRYPVATLCLRFVLSWLLILQTAELFSDEADSLTTEAAPQVQTETNTDINLVAVDNSGYTHNIKRLLTLFIYHLEASENSRCQLADSERAIELNDYQYLALKKDDTAEYGVIYQVKACVSPGITLPQTASLSQQ